MPIRQELKMGAETKIIVRVLKAYEETVEVYAVTRLEAEAEARRMEGVVAVLESGYPEDMSNLPPHLNANNPEK
jgi:hypothetical protein